MKRGWKKGLTACVLAAAMSCRISLAAAEPGEVLSFGTEDRNIVLYVQNPGEEYEIQCKIGTSEAEAVESHPIREEDVPAETIILLDNSLSVVEQYRPVISTILSELAANRMAGELFTVATFSEEVNYLVQDCSDYAQLRQAIDSISYNNQETYLTDVLYDMLTEINAENNTVLRRIVIISDGVDNKSIGYTKEELYGLLEKTPYPIFTIGCTYKDNGEQLKNMFALSRVTGGESYLLDEVSEPMTIVNGIAALNDAVKVTVTPKAKDCDGTKKGIGLTVTAGGQSVSNTLEVTMPFFTVEETTQAETTQAETTSAAPEPVIAETKSVPVLPLLIGGGILLAVSAGGAVFFLLRKRKKENHFVPVASEAVRGREDGAGEDSYHTQLVGTGSSNGNEGTVLLWGKNTAHRLILEDVNNPIKRFEVSLNSPVLVGYSNECQICLNYEPTVSRSHCQIYGENGKFYVKNLSQTNYTFLDGKKVVGTAEIYTGCVLLLGNLKMRVEIR